MSKETRTRQKPGRKSLVATHPQREAIEATCAAGISLRRVAEKFGVPRMAIWRYWHGLSPEHRARVATDVSAQDDARSREVLAGLAAIARRHPAARTDIADLTRRIWPSQPGAEIGRRDHAA